MSPILSALVLATFHWTSTLFVRLQVYFDCYSSYLVLSKLIWWNPPFSLLLSFSLPRTLTVLYPFDLGVSFKTHAWDQ